MEYDQIFQYFEKSLIVLRKSIIPIYKMDSQKGRPDFIGSSIYCQFGPYKMLFSAGHVFNHILPDLPWYQYSMSEMRKLPCNEYRFPNDELNDTGIAVLNDDLPMWSAIPSRFFSVFKQDVEYQHILVGYPASSTKRSTSDTQKIEIKGYLTNAAPIEEYSRLKINQEKEFIISFKKKNVFGENRNKLTFPNPNGMSGGGVFQFHEQNPKKLSLVGIMTRWDVNKKNAIIATRIESITRLFNIMKIDMT